MDQILPSRRENHQTQIRRRTEIEDALLARPKTVQGQTAQEALTTRLAGWHVEGHQKQHGTDAHVLAGHHESHSMLLALAEPSSLG